MKCSILSWNVRGRGTLERRRLVQELVCRLSPEIVILQETKLERMERDTVRSLCHFSNVGWVTLPSIGAAGRIVLFWNKDVVDYEDT